MGWVDSHCHLNFASLEPETLIPKMQQQKCEAVLVPATELNLFADVLDLKNQYPNFVYWALGLHPYFLQSHQLSHLEQLEVQIQQNHPNALGEFGLDFMLKDSDIELQYVYLREQIKLAKSYQLPLVIHCRKAHDQLASELRQLNFHQGGFIHGFSGSVQQAKRYLDMGFVLGLGGALTYERANAMRKMVAALPDEGFTLETDSPDMAPAFAQGQINTPLNIPRIAEYIAQIRNQTVEQIIEQTTVNFFRTLGLNQEG